MKKIFIKLFIFAMIIFLLICMAEKIIFFKNTKEVSNIENNELQENSFLNKNECNVLVLGNSITIERDGIGMAASDEYHDYYYLTKQALQAKFENVKMERISVKDWEENRIIESREAWVDETLTEEKLKNLDIVIFQLGDNLVPSEDLEPEMNTIVNKIKEYSPNVKMIWVGMWFINEDRLSMMPKICEKLNIEFVNISDLVVDENKSYIGAEVTTITGEKNTIQTREEAFHPNDIGMQKIADRVINAIGL